MALKNRKRRLSQRRKNLVPPDCVCNRYPWFHEPGCPAGLRRRLLLMHQAIHGKASKLPAQHHQASVDELHALSYRRDIKYRIGNGRPVLPVELPPPHLIRET